MDDVFGRAPGVERAGTPAAAGPTGHDIRCTFVWGSRLWQGWTPPGGAPRVAPRPIGYEPGRDRGTRGDVAAVVAAHGDAPDLVAGAWDGEGHMAGPGLRAEPTGLARASLAPATAWGADPAMALTVTGPAAKMTRIRVPVSD